MKGRILQTQVILCFLVYILLQFNGQSIVSAELSFDTTNIDIIWEQTYGGPENDRGFSVLPTSDGGYMVLGATGSYGEGGLDYWLIKVESDGTHEWNRSYGAIDDDRGYEVVETDDNGFALLGDSRKNGNGDRDFWIVKVDSMGNELWNYTYGGADNDIFRSGVYTSDGGFAMTGGTFSYGPDQDVWVIKVNGSGHEEWNATYGGEGDQRGLSLVETSDSGFALSSGYGVWKIDNLGVQQWNNTFGISGSDFFNNIIQTSDGGFVVSGGSNLHGAVGNNDFVIARVSQDGTYEWIVTHGGIQRDNSCCNRALVETADGSLLMTGNTYSFDDLDGDVWLLKTDAAGSELWNEPLGGDAYDDAGSIHLQIDGSFLIVGQTESQGAGGSDVWLINAEESTPTPTPTSSNDQTPNFDLLIAGTAMLTLGVVVKRRRARKYTQ
ncbi:MAG: hypothetical protein ACW99A_03485 [Candidatus Kariarchaeaceae archaeon]|jgi:predicted secreted protein